MYCQEKGKTLMITKNTNPEEVDIAKRFDIAFLDIDMPQMSGIELARRVHSLQPDTIIIFITNYIQYAPEGYEFTCLLAIGYPDENAFLPKQKEIKVEDRIHRNVW